MLVNGCDIARYDPDYIASRFAFMQSAPVHSAGSVMDDDQIDAYIELKMEEVIKFEHTPHPVEFDLYYSV